MLLEIQGVVVPVKQPELFSFRCLSAAPTFSQARRATCSTWIGEVQRPFFRRRILSPGPARLADRPSMKEHLCRFESLNPPSCCFDRSHGRLAARWRLRPRLSRWDWCFFAGFGGEKSGRLFGIGETRLQASF